MGEDKLFYLDKSNTIRLQLFRPDIRAAGNRGALNDYPARVPAGSRLAAYWPSLLSQEPGGVAGRLRWTRYWGLNADKHHDFWEHEDANITASDGTGLAVVPASSKYAGAGGFIFRRGDGKVFNSLGDHYDGGFNGTAWDKGECFFLLIWGPPVLLNWRTVLEFSSPCEIPSPPPNLSLSQLLTPLPP